MKPETEHTMYQLLGHLEAWFMMDIQTRRTWREKLHIETPENIWDAKTTEMLITALEHVRTAMKQEGLECSKE